MKSIASRPFLASLSFLALLAGPLHAATLTNSGFEAPVTSDGPPFVGFWETFSSGATATAVNSTDSPHTGSQSLRLEIAATANAFAGAFQDVPSLLGGQPATLTGFHRSGGAVLDLGIEIRIEWRNSVSNTEISRTANLTPIPGSAYEMFSLNAIVPAGADTARVVYAVQTFGGLPTNTGLVYLDDVNFAVPEPGSSVLALGALGCLLRRRR